MQGALIVSADHAVRQSLAVVLQPGRAVRKARNLSECLALATAETFDFIFIDGIFDDGSADELAARLHAVGYGPEIIPVLLSLDNSRQKPFRQYGVRFCVAKPFNVQEIEHVLGQIEDIVRLSDTVIQHARDRSTDETMDLPPESLPFSPAFDDGVSIREVSQFFRRLLAHMQTPEELIRAFADNLQDHFEVDNVVVLLPADNRPAFTVAYGDIPAANQIFIPFDDPLLKRLIRLGEPIQVCDCERLGRCNALSAIRYGERLNCQTLCPVLSRGRLQAVVGMSRLHRFGNRSDAAGLLRLFLTFFADALEYSEGYRQTASTSGICQAMLEGVDVALIAVSSTGLILRANEQALRLLGKSGDELLGQPVERIGSLPAHHARLSLEEERPSKAEAVDVNGRRVMVSATPLRIAGAPAGGMLSFREVELAESSGWRAETLRPPAGRTASATPLSSDVVEVIAHNFKNAFVPVQTCAELLPSRYQDEVFHDFFMHTVRENIGKMDAWIDQLLSYACVGEATEETFFPLREAVACGVAAARAAHPHIEAEFKVDYAPNETVRGDRQRLERVFAELVCNALEAVRNVSKPTVEIATEIVDQQVVAVVRDNGEGMDETIKPLVFQPFFGATSGGKLGLGLSFAQRAVAAGGGTLHLASRAGGGVEVRLAFPLAAGNKASPSTTDPRGEADR